MGSTRRRWRMSCEFAALLEARIGTNEHRVGNVLSPGGGGGSLARMAVLAAGFPVSTAVAGAFVSAFPEVGADFPCSDEQAVLFGTDYGGYYRRCNSERND